MFNTHRREGSLYGSEEYYSENDDYRSQPQNRHVDPIEQSVYKIFAKYDKNRSGYLEKNEILKLLDEILLN
jgi:Ca2+-binding EF-hand superfamily protein